MTENQDPSSQNEKIFKIGKSRVNLTTKAQIMIDFFKTDAMNRSNSRRKVKRQKTPNDILKENILKHKQNRRKQILKQITDNNIKLFQRIQSKKSFYLNAPQYKNQLEFHENETKNQQEIMTSRQRSQRCNSAHSQIRIRYNRDQNAQSKITIQNPLSKQNQICSFKSEIKKPIVKHSISTIQNKENYHQNESFQNNKPNLSQKLSNRLLNNNYQKDIFLSSNQLLTSRQILKQNDKSNFNLIIHQLNKRKNIQ